MCGRYVSPDDAAIEREFNLVRTEWQFPPSFNVEPSQLVPIVRSVDGECRGARLRWGLIPFFARGVPPKYSTINARISKSLFGRLDEASIICHAFLKRRGDPGKCDRRPRTGLP